MLMSSRSSAAVRSTLRQPTPSAARARGRWHRYGGAVARRGGRRRCRVLRCRFAGPVAAGAQHHRRQKQQRRGDLWTAESRVHEGSPSGRRTARQCPPRQRACRNGAARGVEQASCQCVHATAVPGAGCRVPGAGCGCGCAFRCRLQHQILLPDAMRPHARVERTSLVRLRQAHRRQGSARQQADHQRRRRPTRAGGRTPSFASSRPIRR